MKGLNKGFTLIELMVAVAIIGILAAIAYPSYVDYVLRGKIAEAVAALSDGRVRMEQSFMDNRAYLRAAGGGLLAVNPCAARGPIQSLSTQNFAVTCIGAATTATTFTLQANGVGSMAGFTYTINEQNQRVTTSLPAKWTNAATTAAMPNCWVLKKDGSC